MLFRSEFLGPHPRRGPKQPHLPDLGDLQRTFWRDPIVGKSNPIAPPVEIEIVERVVRGRVNLGYGYEGPPGYVHGAVIAGIFDQILGLANLASGNVGMTGTLTIKYRKPTPLDVELRLEGAVDRAEGRKTFVRGSLFAGDDLLGEAEGLFVAVGAEWFNALMQQ